MSLVLFPDSWYGNKFKVIYTTVMEEHVGGRRGEWRRAHVYMNVRTKLEKNEFLPVKTSSFECLEF